METEDICCNTVRLGADGRIADDLESVGVGLNAETGVEMYLEIGVESIIISESGSGVGAGLLYFFVCVTNVEYNACGSGWVMRGVGVEVG